MINSEKFPRILNLFYRAEGGGEVTCQVTHKLWLEEFTFSDTDLISNYIASDWGLIGSKFLFNDYCQVNIKTESHHLVPAGLELDM